MAVRQLFQNMVVRRQVFVNRHCADCGGKVMRRLLGSKELMDENGSEVFQTQVVEVCDCPHKVHARSTLVSWPCIRLDELFDRWENGQLKLEDFDRELIDILTVAHSIWQTKAS